MVKKTNSKKTVKALTHDEATRTRLECLITRGLVTEVGSRPRDQKRRCYLA